MHIVSKSLVVLSMVFGPLAQAAEPVFSPDVPAAVQAQTKADIQMVAGLQGSGGTPIYRQMFGDGMNGRNMMDFFSTRITQFGMNDCGGGPAVAACVRPMVDNVTMWLTPNYVRFNMPQIYRVSVIFHESRHTESDQGYWGHIHCPTPFRDAAGNDIKGIMSGTILAGLPACDETAFGAYALQAELLKNVQLNCTNCTEKMKMDGELFGDDTVKRISEQAAHDQLARDVAAQ